MAIASCMRGAEPGRSSGGGCELDVQLGKSAQQEGWLVAVIALAQWSVLGFADLDVDAFGRACG